MQKVRSQEKTKRQENIDTTREISDQEEQKQKNKKMENKHAEIIQKQTENKEVKMTFLQRKMFMSKKIL